MSKAETLGKFYVAANKLADKRGGKQKLQRIVGAAHFYQNKANKYWYYSLKINAKSMDELNSWTAQIGQALTPVRAGKKSK